MKAMGSRVSLKELADEFGAQGEYRALYKDAELGRQYARQLQDEVVRLCLSLELGVAEPVLRKVFSTTAGEDLMAVKMALEERLTASMPLTTQLRGFQIPQALESGFLI